METHLAEPTLNPAEIANAVGISVRHLHRLFSCRGSTVTEWIRGGVAESPENAIADDVALCGRGSQSSIRQRLKTPLANPFRDCGPLHEKRRCRCRTEMPTALAISAGFSVGSAK